MSDGGEIGVFEQRVTEAIDDFIKSFQDAIKADVAPPRMSIAAFTKRYKISRSVLYDKYPHLRTSIGEAFDLLSKQQKECVRKSKKTKSIAGLSAELSELQASAKRQIAIAHSTSFNNFLERYGPVLRSAEEQWREREVMLQTIQDLRQQNANLTRINRELLKRSNG